MTKKALLSGSSLKMLDDPTNSRISNPSLGRITPIAVSPSRAAELLGIGRTFLYELINDGSLKTAKIGSRRLITIDAIRALLASREVST